MIFQVPVEFVEDFRLKKLNSSILTAFGENQLLKFPSILLLLGTRLYRFPRLLFVFSLTPDHVTAFHSPFFYHLLLFVALCPRAERPLQVFFRVSMALLMLSKGVLMELDFDSTVQ